MTALVHPVGRKSGRLDLGVNIASLACAYGVYQDAMAERAERMTATRGPGIWCSSVTSGVRVEVWG